MGINREFLFNLCVTLIRAHPLTRLLNDTVYLRDRLSEEGVYEYLLLRTCCEDVYKQHREIGDHIDTVSRLLKYMLRDIQVFKSSAMNAPINKYQFDRFDIGTVYVYATDNQWICNKCTTF